jgi:hypothetical protein
VRTSFPVEVFAVFASISVLADIRNHFTQYIHFRAPSLQLFVCNPLATFVERLSVFEFAFEIVSLLRKSGNTLGEIFHVIKIVHPFHSFDAALWFLWGLVL